MPLNEETKKKLREIGREDLIKHEEIKESGYMGCMPNGNLVDRREHPEAIPVMENQMLGFPKPQELPGDRTAFPFIFK